MRVTTFTTTGDDEVAVDNEIDHELLSEAETIWAQREWSIQHVLFPSMKLFFKPPHSLAENGTFIRVSPLETDTLRMFPWFKKFNFAHRSECIQE